MARCKKCAAPAAKKETPAKKATVAKKAVATKKTPAAKKTAATKAPADVAALKAQIKSLEAKIAKIKKALA
ncbi:MAG: hypothetical protein IKM88_16055 [Lachnospiraceae bacterium]|nr:hypothetical protein [Lachnospiraceae bacterium]